MPDRRREYLDRRWGDLVDALEAEGVAPDEARAAVARAVAGLSGRREPDDREVWGRVRESAGLPADPGGTPPRADRAPQPDDVPDRWLAAALQARGARRRRTSVLASLAALWLVAGLSVAAWWAARPEPPAVREAANPLPVPWYADGELHLDRVAVTLGELEEFRAVGSQVLVREPDGDLVRVRADGSVTGAGEAAWPDAPEVLEPDGYADRDFEVRDLVRAPDGTVVAVGTYGAGGSRDEFRRSSEAGASAVRVCASESSCRDVPVDADGPVQLR